ncbi:MAG: CBS domain-containing protein [Candidatus Kariarchaeaceae archaeon]|jgi:CBS domain-containing protein
MQNVLENHVGEFATKEVVTIEQGKSIRYALGKMIGHRLRRLPIIDQEENLLGIVAATDIFRLLQRKMDPDALQAPLDSILISKVVKAEPSMELRDVIKLMTRSQVSGIPLVADNRIQGIFANRDILVIDRLWEKQTDEFITSETGFGKQIDAAWNLITDDFTISQAMNRIVQTEQRHLLVKEKESNFYPGLVNMMSILRFITAKLTQESNLDFLHQETTKSVMQTPMFQKGTPILISSLRLWMMARGVEAVPLFYRNNPIRLVTEIDMVQYVSRKLFGEELGEGM